MNQLIGKEMVDQYNLGVKFRIFDPTDYIIPGKKKIIENSFWKEILEFNFKQTNTIQYLL